MHTHSYWDTGNWISECTTMRIHFICLSENFLFYFVLLPALLHTGKKETSACHFAFHVKIHIRNLYIAPMLPMMSAASLRSSSEKPSSISMASMAWVVTCKASKTESPLCMCTGTRIQPRGVQLLKLIPRLRANLDLIRHHTSSHTAHALTSWNA